MTCVHCKFILTAVGYDSIIDTRKGGGKEALKIHGKDFN